MKSLWRLKRIGSSRLCYLAALCDPNGSRYRTTARQHDNWCQDHPPKIMNHPDFNTTFTISMDKYPCFACYKQLKAWTESNHGTGCHAINLSWRHVSTHWSRDKMADNILTTFSNAFSRIKTYWFRLRFHWSLFPCVQSTIFQHWFR